MYQVLFGSVIAHEGANEREAYVWYGMLVNAAHTYGRRLELREGAELICYISAASARVEVTQP